jgi:hypothetical protein
VDRQFMVLIEGDQHSGCAGPGPVCTTPRPRLSR